MHKLRISVGPWLPWASPPKDGQLNVQGAAEDFYGSLRRIGITHYDLQVGDTFGSLREDNTWSGIIGGLTRNESDVSGPFFINQQRADVVDFATPLGFSQLAIMTGLVSENNNPFLLFSIFSFKVILLFISSAFLCSGVTCLIYTLLSNIYSARTKRLSVVFLKYLWIFHFSLIGHEFGSNYRWFLRHIWWTGSFRSLQSVWLMASLVVVYTYQGAIISTFASDKLKPRISSLKELQTDSNMKIGTFKNSYAYSCLEKLKNTQYDSIFRRVQDGLVTPPKTGIVPQWLDLVEEGKLVFFNDILLAKAQLGDRFVQRKQCGIRTIGIDLGSSYLSFAFRKHFSQNFIRKFNMMLLRFNQGALAHRKVMASTIYYDICSHADTATTRPLAFTDVSGAFALLGLGLVISCGFFLTEIYIHRQRRSEK